MRKALNYSKIKFELLSKTFICAPIISNGFLLDKIEFGISMPNINAAINYFLTNNQGFILSQGIIPFSYCSNGMKINLKKFLYHGLFYIFFTVSKDVECLIYTGDKNIYLINKKLNVSKFNIKFEKSLVTTINDNCIPGKIPLFGKIKFENTKQLSAIKKQHKSILFWDKESETFSNNLSPSQIDKFSLASIINSHDGLFEDFVKLKNTFTPSKLKLKNNINNFFSIIILPINDKEFEENIKEFLSMFKINFDIKLVIAQHGIKLKNSTTEILKNKFKKFDIFYYPKKLTIGSIWSNLLEIYFGQTIIKLDCDDFYKREYIDNLIKNYLNFQNTDLGGFSGSIVENVSTKRLFLKTKISSNKATKLLGGSLIFNNNKKNLLKSIDNQEREIDRIIEKHALNSKDFGTSLEYFYKRRPNSLWRANSSWYNSATEITYFSKLFNK